MCIRVRIKRRWRGFTHTGLRVSRKPLRFVRMLQSTKMPRWQSVARLLPVLTLLVATLLAEPVKPAPIKPAAAKTNEQARSLEDRVAAVLAAPDLARGFWGIEVVSLSSDNTSGNTSSQSSI